MWGYGAWNNWENEEGSTKEIVGRMCIKKNPEQYGLSGEDVYN